MVSKKNEAENIISLFFKPADGLDFNFIAGQYVSVMLPSIVGRSKCYTISSSPSEKLICLTIKRQGEFSSALIDLNVGDKLVFNGPFGRFFPEENCKDIVFIAGGIGITPFFSVIKDKVNCKIKPKMTLLCSNKTISDIAFFDELNELAKNKGIDKLVYFLTQEKGENPFVQEYSRINKESLKKHLSSFEKIPTKSRGSSIPKGIGRNYYLCGSIQFVNSVWKDLKENGVPEENIFTESFY